jgi:predicted DNA-binding transcriptional regulator YafY
MGRRSAAETAIAILTAFIENTSWTQVALAARVGVSVPQLRKHLIELVRHDVPLEDEREPPNVIWSVPAKWFPAGVTLTAADAHELLRQLSRAPQSADRDRLLMELATRARRDPPAGITRSADGDFDEATLRLVEDACTSTTALSLRYYSASHGRPHDRVVSIQRVLAGVRPRIVAHCHAARELRFFRVSRIQSATLNTTTPFTHVPEADVDAFLAGSVSGYRDPTEPVHVAFVVRDPEARWVRDTLPVAMTIEPMPTGVRLSTRTAGVLSLARFVVGLGDAARAESPELLAAVHDLAAGSLASHGPAIRSVTPIRSTGSSRDGG